MGAWIRRDVRKIGLVLKANSKQMGRAAGGHKQLSRSLGARYLFFVPSHLAPCFPPATRLPLSHSDFSSQCFAKTALFSHRWLRPEPSLLKSGHLGGGNLRAFCPDLSPLPLSRSMADAQQRRHGGLCLCSVHATDHHLDKQLITLSDLSFLRCESWWSAAPFHDPCWI